MRLIDPKDLLDYINEQKICGECESCTDIDCMNCFTTDLEDIPTIEAEQVIHAHWDYENKLAECSNCRRRAHYDVEADRIDSFITPYCPYCGAKMDNAD